MWLARIALNEALGRLQHKRGEFAGPGQANEGAVIQFPLSAQNENPERTMAQRQITQLVERAADALPDAYRLVFVTHVIEGMNVEETAELLGIEPETVKTRLHRARQLLLDQVPVCRPPSPTRDRGRADALRLSRIVAEPFTAQSI